MNKEKQTSNNPQNGNSSLGVVSESFREEIKSVMKHHLSEEEKHAKRGNYQNAIYHNTTAAAMQEVLIRCGDYNSH